MKRYSVLIMALLLIFAVAVSGSVVLAQDGSDFGELIQRIEESEGLSDQEKEEIIVRSIELRYEDGLEVYQITGVLDEYDDYDGIMDQFDEIENNDSDEEDDWIDSDNSDFGGLILDTLELEDLNNQEREQIMVRAAELHYEDGLEVYQITGVLDEYDDYDEIMDQFDEIENNDSDDDGLIEETEEALFGEDGLFDEDEDGLFD